MKTLSILGCTGSIGVSTLDVVKRFTGKFRVKAMACGTNINLLEEQVRAFKPEVVSVGSAKDARELSKRLGGLGVKVLSGPEGMSEVASLSGVDMVLSAIVGSAGLVPTMAAIEAGKDVALANKETLVCAGELVISAAKRRGIKLLPVDSEHSAIFQSMKGHRKADLARITLTASGGPFQALSSRQLENVKPADALKHPNWEMGRKITIDSATLMNKGLEVIEAKWLFDVGMHEISVVVHPQSIIHSMVEFKDGSVIAQLGVPDMRGPISYALGYPCRLKKDIPGLDLVKVGTLTFKEPDMGRFPCLAYAFDAMKAGGTMSAVLNAANEVAVAAFLDGHIGFMDIPKTIKATMDAHRPSTPTSVEDVMKADRWARREAGERVKRRV
ncbi:MAG: 1-deoxy-D-xylulose-5-phosphate reductoisomerase [Nitrospirae bacterium]|nr:1-deoxy-D-xylulose-5-phosphate reductoisomerase [Nitrospirota bacterium]